MCLLMIIAIYRERDYYIHREIAKVYYIVIQCAPTHTTLRLLLLLLRREYVVGYAYLCLR
jgi:anion-transporting  ArsA/GET3 family ATPase